MPARRYRNPRAKVLSSIVDSAQRQPSPLSSGARSGIFDFDDDGPGFTFDAAGNDFGLNVEHDLSWLSGNHGDVDSGYTTASLTNETRGSIDATVAWDSLWCPPDDSQDLALPSTAGRNTFSHDLTELSEQLQGELDQTKLDQNDSDADRYKVGRELQGLQRLLALLRDSGRSRLYGTKTNNSGSFSVPFSTPEAMLAIHCYTLTIRSLLSTCSRLLELCEVRTVGELSTGDATEAMAVRSWLPETSPASISSPPGHSSFSAQIDPQLTLGNVSSWLHPRQHTRRCAADTIKVALSLLYQVEQHLGLPRNTGILSDKELSTVLRISSSDRAERGSSQASDPWQFDAPTMAEPQSSSTPSHMQQSLCARLAAVIWAEEPGTGRTGHATNDTPLAQLRRLSKNIIFWRSN
ncbi:hypothetical protein B0A48_15446 [Cryoendolithus antarcticus]|uniref:Aflatoxin regulatory protein domain-containing protein n=1 Tax=Cryoendolithus antarcticus TaxID=1507870 RepID=A0A1V8SIB0_9PEZI|nr:hypothetical protein B0A48_15446 [Cryoendolithus antarcticus]